MDPSIENLKVVEEVVLKGKDGSRQALRFDPPVAPGEVAKLLANAFMLLTQGEQDDEEPDFDDTE